MMTNWSHVTMAVFVGCALIVVIARIGFKLELQPERINA